MRSYIEGIGILATAILVSQHFAPVALANINGLEMQGTAQGFNLRLATNNNTRPQIFTIQRDNVLVADLTDTRLNSETGNFIEQNNPFPGVEYVSVSQAAANSVRVIVRGTENAPNAQIGSFVNGELTLNVQVKNGGSGQRQGQREQNFFSSSTTAE